MILLDAGNTRAHLWQDGQIEHMLLSEAVRRYHAQRVAYINVNPHNDDLLSAIADWENLAPKLHIEGEYEGMGIDRKVLCLSHPEGIFVDAGSAITVDRVTDGVYQGGFIYPGLQAMSKAYTAISPVLDVELNHEVDLHTLPKTTQNSVSYGTIAPIVAAIEKLRGDLPLYITGGDSEILAKHFPDAVHDEGVVFRGMKNGIVDV
jgi:type III pantothenate kinase